MSLPDGRVIDQTVTVNEVAVGARSARFFSLAKSNPGALASHALLRGSQVQALASPRHLSRLSRPDQPRRVD